jgi:hypothetical protein
MSSITSPAPVDRAGEPAEGWRAAWARVAFRIELAATAGSLALTLAALSWFLAWVETRPDVVVLADPLLAAIPPRDFSMVTFGLIYGGIVLGLGTLATSPRRLLRALQAYVLLLLLRMLLMWLVPLEAPAGMVPLRDPVVESFGPARMLMRDLFFSGHASTLFLLALAARGRALRLLLLVATVLVAVLLVWQHVHYAVDVIVGPFVAKAAYDAAGALSGARAWRVSGCTMREQGESPRSSTKRSTTAVHER